MSPDGGRWEIDGRKVVETGREGYWRREGEAADEGFYTESGGRETERLTA